jgi:hypothetical protein
MSAAGPDCRMRRQLEEQEQRCRPVDTRLLNSLCRLQCSKCSNGTPAAHREALIEAVACDLTTDRFIYRR